MTAKRLDQQLMEEDPEAMAEYERTRPQHDFVLAMVEARNERGWTQRDLATAMGVSQPVIARLESGDHDVKLNTVGAVCKALGIEFTIGGRNLVPQDVPAKRRSA
ncbi:MAG: helix-turn-helix transcriptional regulator [Thermoleophilia bacterium]|nr:helix-turn-helix transcriptional regulator [Thermoleophilia bacterium]